MTKEYILLVILLWFHMKILGKQYKYINRSVLFSTDYFIRDMHLNYFMEGENELKLVNELLKMRQFAPNAPSSVPSKPLASSNSFMTFHESPHLVVLFSSDSKYKNLDVDAERTKIRMVCVPSYKESCQFVILKEGNISQIQFNNTIYK